MSGKNTGKFYVFHESGDAGTLNPFNSLQQAIDEGIEYWGEDEAEGLIVIEAKNVYRYKKPMSAEDWVAE